MDLRFKKAMSYREQWTQLNRIFPYAMKDFGVNLDSFQTVFISRLITTGDLAIQVSKEYHQKFNGDRTLSHSRVSSFLMKSALASDWNMLLKNYGIEIDTMVTEKNFFASAEEVYMGSKIETEPSAIPQQILDCMTWIKLKRKRKSVS
jgi:hypothetical protein